MKLLTAIFGTGAYFYALPILFQHGYNSYFGIPANFIEVSIRDNIIFLFSLMQIAGGVAKLMSFWVWLILAIVVAVIWFMWVLKILSGKFISFVLILLTAISLFGFYNFGGALAKLTTEFYIIPNGCLQAKEENITYIVPSFFGKSAVIIPIHKDTNKLTGGFLIKESSDLNCEIQKSTVGKVTR